MPGAIREPYLFDWLTLKLSDSPSGKAARHVLPETRAIAALGCTDLLATVYLIASNRAREVNPLAVHAIQAYGLAGLILFKFTLLAAPLTIAELYRSRKPALVTNALRFVLIAYLILLALAYWPALMDIYAYV